MNNKTNKKIAINKDNIALESTIYIIDDDRAIVESLAWIIESINLKYALYYSAQDFLNDYNGKQYGCILLDVRMPGMSGPELQTRLNALGSSLPIIFISGYGDVSLAVHIMKSGAMDFFS